MKRRRITILHDGEPITHIAANYGSYETVCGCDGDDEFAGQKPTTTDQRSKVDCEHCHEIWKECRSFTKVDFAQHPGEQK